MKLTNYTNTRVLPVEFDYYAPRTLDEAVKILTSVDNAYPLAGGLDLLVFIKLGFVRPRALVNVKGIQGLRYISDDGDSVKIGSTTTVLDLERSELVRRHLPLLYRVSRDFSSIQVRSMTTVGGNLASASPASDLATALLALDARIGIYGPSGYREVPIDSFYLGPRKTVLARGELLAYVRVKKSAAGEGFGYQRIARIYEDIAKVIAAARVRIEDGKFSEVAISLGSVAPRVIRSRSVEQALFGRPATQSVIEEASKLTVNDISPIDDIRSTAEYRRDVAPVLVKRALLEAVSEVV